MVNQSQISLAWRDLTFQINEWTSWKWKKKVILQPMSGHCLTGTLTGILGPSGSGLCYIKQIFVNKN